MARLPKVPLSHGAALYRCHSPQHHSQEAPFPHGAAAYRYWSPMVPRPPGAMFCAAAPSRYCLLPAAVLPPGTAVLMVPFPPGTMFYSAVPSRYHPPAVLLPPGARASWSAPSSLHPNSTAMWIVCSNIPVSYPSSPTAILFQSILFHSIMTYDILFPSILF